MRKFGPTLFVAALLAAGAVAAQPTPAQPPPLPLPPLIDLPANGLAPTPPMGWNSWGRFHAAIDEATVRAMADALVTSGLRDAGYVYVNIDDGWQGPRAADGTITPGPGFHDMKALGDYLHARGLKFGIYSSPGPLTCAGFAGSYGHEAQDAQTYAAWGVDFLKYDWCSAGFIYHTRPQMRAAYQKMAQALRVAGRPIVFSLCQYGLFDVGEWGAAAGGHLWRTSQDIYDTWASMTANGLQRSGDARDAGPGRWNDPDLLQVGGGGMSEEEYRTQLTIWAMLAAPLLLGDDVRALSPALLDMLRNREVIAVDQDPLGRPAQYVGLIRQTQIWARPLAGGRTALGLYNLGQAPFRLELQLAALALPPQAQVRDVWRGQDLGLVSDLDIQLPPHGAALLVVAPSLNGEGATEKQSGVGK